MEVKSSAKQLKELKKMNQPSVDKDIVDFINMAEDPVPFDPITYVDRTQGWKDVNIPLNKIRVKDIKTNVKKFGNHPNVRKLTERYAVITFDTDNPILSGKDWKVFNRVADKTRSRSAPAFAQLCTRVNPITGHTCDEIKALSSDRQDHKDANDKWVYVNEKDKAIKILNNGLAKITEERTLRVNPQAGKVECFVSDKYAPITNKEMLTFLHAEIGDFDIVREFHSDRRSLFQVLPRKFSGLSDSEDYGMFIENSNTGANRLGMGMFVITGACSNGMMFVQTKYGKSEYLARKHFGDKEIVVEIIQDHCKRIGDRVQEIYNKIEIAKDTPLWGENYSKEYMVENLLRPLGESTNLAKKSVSQIEKLLEEKYQQDTVWDFISAMTEAAQKAPPNSREHIEKVAGNMLEQLVPTIPAQ
jgi:hypothetical protein